MVVEYFVTIFFEVLRMAILVIWASPDKNGLTAQIKNQLVKGIENTGCNVEEVHLNRKKIQCCAACGKGGYGNCMREGKCILTDDFQDIYDAMIQADAFVFVTPVYWHDLAENLKCLLDRLRRCETAHNGFLQGKRALIAACAGGYGYGTCESLVALENTLKHMGIETADRIAVQRFNNSYMTWAAFEAGKIFAANYKDFRFDQFDFWS